MKVTSRWIIGGICVMGLLTVFLFQQTNLAKLCMPEVKPVYAFLVNRTIRFFLNDLFAIGLIYALFVERKYVVFSIWVQVAGTVFILIPYFILKLYFPGYNGPMISFLHRLILNPIVLLLLIPAFYAQIKSR
ncbi:MAG: exosortase F system-associated protein [Cyclobacteriaceae bacterium]|nr:exosortase F system-associated protein [Cyclobacteriaceae bacterium]